MVAGVFAEASPCCPSALFGQLMVVAYLVGGVLVYLWLFSLALGWARSRYRQHRLPPERNR